MNEQTDKKEWLYAAYKDKVQRYISGKISDFHTVEDLTSSVFLKIYQNYHTFDEQKASLSTWIYTITQHTVYDYYRTNKRLYELPESLCIDGSVEDTLIQQKDLEELADALEHLPQRERDVILLHYYKEMTLKEIAQLMGVSYATAKNIHQRAMIQLKAELQR